MDDYWLVVHFYFSGVIVYYCDCDFYGVVGEQGFDAFGPLHEAWVARVEVVVESEVEGFFGTVDAIEVEVVDCAFVAFVFVYDGECWAIDFLGYTELLADCFDEGGFAGSHLSVEGEQLTVLHCLDYGFCGFLDLVDCIGQFHDVN